MKRSTSTRKSPKLSQSISELSHAPIKAVYINSLPPRGKFLHGASVEFFFPKGELAISGDIIQVAPKEEAFYLTFSRTLGSEYWQNETVNRRGEPVVHITRLDAEWRSHGLEALIGGPRDVRLYTKSNLKLTDDRLKGVAIVAKQAPSQRVLFVASDDDPGDVIVVTPSDEYKRAIIGLTQLLRP